MNFFDLLRLSFEALTERKVRAILTVLMVVIGAALVTGLTGLTSGMNDYVLKQFGSLGANVIIISPTRTRGGGTPYQITEQTAILFQSMDGVNSAIPYIQQTGTVTSGSVSQNTFIIGVNQEQLPLIFPTISLVKGEFGPPQDAVDVVLGNTLAYPKGDATPFADYNQALTIRYTVISGQTRSTSTRTFRVGGILSYMGTSGMFIPVDRMVLLSLSAANALFKKSGIYDGMFVIANDQSQVDNITTEINDLTGGKVEVSSAKSIIQTIENVMGSIQLVMGSIAAVSLIVASVGIFTALYTSVMERTREIGVLKALGFKKWMIVGMFINEAVLIGIIGGAIGDLGGMGLAYVLQRLFSGTGARINIPGGGGMGGFGGATPQSSALTPVFTPEMLIFVWGFCTVLSVLAGIYPAWRASRLDPVVALRKE